MEINEQHKRQFLSDMELMGLKEALLDGYYDVLATGKQISVSWREYSDFGDHRVLYEPELRLDDSGLPYLYGYTATLLETHPIHHGIYEQIDTWQLEAILREGKWVSDAVLFSQLYAQITELSVCGNSRAKDIAQRLEARYWLGTTVDRFVNGIELRRKFGRTHFFSCDQQELSNLTVTHAYNLLSGRPVLRFSKGQGVRSSRGWIGLKRLRQPIVIGQQLHWFQEKGYPDFGPGPLIQHLPFKNPLQWYSDLRLVGGLMEGNMVSAPLIIEGKERLCSIAVEAEYNRARVFDEQGIEMDVPYLLTQTAKIREEKEEKPSTRKKPIGRKL